MYLFYGSLTVVGMSKQDKFYLFFKKYIHINAQQWWIYFILMKYVQNQKKEVVTFL